MPLWGKNDQANNAPKWKNLHTKPIRYAQTAPVTTTQGTLTQGSNTITNLSTTTGIAINDRVSSNVATYQNNFSVASRVTAVINTTAIQMSDAYRGTTVSGTANLTFQHGQLSGITEYGNTTPGAFQNNATIDLVNIGNWVNAVVITGNTVAGNTWILNPSANFAVTYGNSASGFGANIAASSNTVQLIANVTGTVAAGVLTISANNYGPTLQVGQIITSTATGWVNSALLSNSTPLIWNLGPLGGSTNTSLTAGAGNTFTTTTLAGVAINQSVYTTATGLSNNSLAVVGINGTNVVLSNTTTTANTSAALVFSNIQPGMVPSGPGFPINGVNNAGQIQTVNSFFTGTVSNGTIGQSGNVLSIVSVSGNWPAIGQELLANGTINIANGTYITSYIGESFSGTGGSVRTCKFGISANLIANGAAGAAVSIGVVTPSVAYVNSTAIVLSGNGYAIANTVANAIAFSSYEIGVFGRNTAAGWNELRWGTGPVTSFTVNATATSNYGNGEMVLVSGGQVNAVGAITTNATGNVTSVAVVYPGAGFANTGSLTFNYTRQQHLANVLIANASVAITGANVGDTFSVTCTYPLANVTGYINGSTLTVTANQSGTLTVGNLLSGGLTLGSVQLTTNSAVVNAYATANVSIGMKVTSNVVGVPTTALIASIINSTAFAMTVPYTGTNTSTAGVTTALQTNTMILAQLTGTGGGIGTYALSNYQFVANSGTTFNQFISTGQIVVATALVYSNGASGAISNSNINVTSTGLYTSGLTAANLVVTYANTGGGAIVGQSAFSATFATASSGAAVNAALGGKAGRIMIETYVPMHVRSENPADGAILPNS